MSFAHDFSSQGNKKSSKHSLHAYYNQTFKARVGTFGLFFIGFLAFVLSAFFFFSLLPIHLKVRLFYKILS